MGSTRGVRFVVIFAPLTVLLLAPACNRTRSLPPKPTGASVVVTPDEASDAQVPAIEESEPNDLLANAQKIDLTTTRSARVTGHLVAALGSRAKDVDLFRIVVPPPSVVVEAADGNSGPTRQRLTIEVQPDAHLAIAVDALDDQGRIMVSASGSPTGEAEFVPNLSVIPGTYFVRIKPAGPAESASNRKANHSTSSDGADAGVAGAAGYQFALSLGAIEVGDEVEPNGRAALANEASAGADLAGFLGWRRDEDWFRLPLSGLPEGSALSIDLDALEGVAASVAVFDSVEQKMTEQKGKKGERVAIRNVRLPSSDPCVYVVVRAESGRNAKNRYTLHLRSEEARADSELEPNDDPGHAVPLADGAFLGYLGPGDVDVYRYTAPMPVELNLEAIPPDHVDLKVEVLRDDGTVMAKIDSGRRREAERLPNLYVEGTILLRLSGANGDGNVDEPYRLNATSRPVEVGAEREPNGSSAQATVLEAGVAGTGLIFPKGDVDYWRTRAVAPPGDQLAVSLRGLPGATLEVRVQGSDGGKDIARFRVGGDASAPVRLPPGAAGGANGCCVLQIREVTGRQANARDRYTLSVTPVTP